MTDEQVSLDPYRRESLKILAIFKEMVPKGEIGRYFFSKIEGSPLMYQRKLLLTKLSLISLRWS